jgi:hypothetical protein
VYKKVVFLLNGERVTARKKEIKELRKLARKHTHLWDRDEWQEVLI